MKKLRILSAGSNARGQLSHNTEIDSHCFRQCQFSSLVSPLREGTEVVRIATGANHTLVLLRDADGRTQLWGCGDGTKGQLGEWHRQEGSSSILTPIDLEQGTHRDVTMIAASWETSFVVLSDISGDGGDILLSMGADDFGDLGIGGSPKGKETAKTPHVVNFDHVFSSKSPVRSLHVFDICAGPHHVLAKVVAKHSDGTAEERVAGWGASRHGQLDPHPSKEPALCIPSPRAVPISHVLSFSLGNQHTVVLRSSGQTCGFGSNKKNQLSGIEPFLHNVRALGTTWNGTYLFVQHRGHWSILATGSNSSGQLARSPSETIAPALVEVRFPSNSAACQFVNMACGSEHVLVALWKPPAVPSELGLSEVWGWGWNEHGNLGLGHTEDVISPTRLWPPVEDVPKPLGKVVGIWAGCGTSWIVVEDN